MLISSSQIPQRFLIFPVFYWPGNTIIAASIRVFKHIYVQFLLNLRNVRQQSDIFIIWEIIHSDTCIPQTKFHPDSQKICEVLEMSLKTLANSYPFAAEKKGNSVWGKTVVHCSVTSMDCIWGGCTQSTGGCPLLWLRYFTACDLSLQNTVERIISSWKAEVRKCEDISFKIRTPFLLVSWISQDQTNMIVSLALQLEMYLIICTK